MTLSISSLDFNSSSKVWQVYVKRPDGTLGYLQLSEDTFVTCGSHLLGQLMLQCWLSRSEPT